MPERLEKLKAIVRELEAELESLDSVDAQSQQLLEGALEDLHSALEKKTPHRWSPTRSPNDFAERKLSSRFPTPPFPGLSYASLTHSDNSGSDSQATPLANSRLERQFLW